MDIQERYNNIKGKKFTMQKSFKICEIAFKEAIILNIRSISKNFIYCLISTIEKVSLETTETIKYNTKFSWFLTSEEIISYALLALYDLKIYTTNNYLLQFEKELDNYSSLDAQIRLDFLLMNWRKVL